MEKPSKFKVMRVMQLIRAKKMTSEDLDSIVIDASLAKATSVNNKGIHAQVNYLFNQMTAENLIEILTRTSVSEMTNGAMDKKIQDLIGDGNKKKVKSESKNTLSEAAEATQPPQDMPAVVEETKIPEFNKPDGPDGTFTSSEIYKNQIETCTNCNSRNIMFLSYEENDLYPQWECHDCGEIFYDQDYNKITPPGKG